jgi:uncharacterized protein YneF (UPF0154 family)
VFRTCTSAFGKPKYKSNLIFPGILFILLPLLGITGFAYDFWNIGTFFATIVIGIVMLIFGILWGVRLSNKSKEAQRKENSEIEERWKSIYKKRIPLEDVLPGLDKYVTDYLNKYKFSNLYSDLNPYPPRKYVTGIKDTMERLEKLKRIYPDDYTIQRLLKAYRERDEEILTPAEKDEARRHFLR